MFDGRLYDVMDKLKPNAFNANLVQELNGEDLSLEFFQTNGFNKPILVKENKGNSKLISCLVN